MIKRIFGCLILLTGNLLIAYAQPEKDKWVDSVYNKLNETERIGQLYMAAVSSHLEDNKLRDLEKDIKSNYVGGVLFTTGNPVKQLTLTNEFQSAAGVPLLISMDASNGLGNQLSGTLTFPDAVAQGAIESDSLIFVFARETA